MSRWPEIARRKIGTPLRYFGLPPERRGALDSGSTCASILHASSRTEAERAAAVGDRRVIPDHRDPDGAGVEPLRVRADHVALGAPVPAFEDLPEPVDEEVVADVVPAVSPYVVQVDPRTTAADCAGLDGSPCVAVWWTTAVVSVLAKLGLPRRIRSSAPRVLRVTIAGLPTIYSDRPSGSSGLQT